MRSRSLIAFFFSIVLIPLLYAENPADGYNPEPLEVLEKVPVADSAFIRHRGLPSSVDLAPHFPVPGRQGNQGSCVGWATTYALKTYQEKRKRNWDLGAPVQDGGNGEHVFSPAWTYNQINGGRDRGAHIPHALELLIDKGAAPWSVMPYNVKDFRSQPSAEARRIAQQYRAKSYEQVPVQNIDALKSELASGNPLVIGVYTGPDRWACCRNGEVFDHFTQKRWMGHAMVIVGYDDRKVSPQGHRGAFKLMDSDGPHAATNGFAWVSYQFAPTFLYAAYVLRDSGTIAPPSVEPSEPELTVPANVRATQGAYTDKIVVSWSKAAGATAYEVERSISGDYNFESIGFAGTNSFQDSSVQEEVAYDYRVISIRDEKKTDASQSTIAKGYAARQVKPTPTPPAPPSPAQSGKPGRVENLAATNGAHRDKIVLTWDAAANATKYAVLRFNRTNYGWDVVAWPTTNRYEDNAPDVQGGALQAYSVRAVNAKEDGAEAKPAWGATNPNLERAGEVPDVPRDVKAELRGNAVNLSWKAVPKVREYYIFRRRFGNREWAFVAAAKQARFSENFPGAAGELWYYIVRSKLDTGGESANSAVAAVASAAERPVIAQRYATDAEIATFAGNWSGEVAGGEKRMQTVTLSVTPSGENYTVRLTVDGRSRNLTGKYIARSGELQLPGLSVTNVPANVSLIAVTCRDRSLCGVPFRGALTRAP